MENAIYAVGASAPEKLGRPELPVETVCSECKTCRYARTGDFCYFSDGTCSRGIVRAISSSGQKQHKKELEEKKTL